MPRIRQDVEKILTGGPVGCCEPLAEMSEPFASIIHAPEFPHKLDWVNSERPLTLRELRGKIVLLHFWTYC